MRGQEDERDVLARRIKCELSDGRVGHLYTSKNLDVSSR